MSNKLWDKYTNKKQTLEELVTEYGKSHIWVRKRLDEHSLTLPVIEPCSPVLVADTTFWGRQYGVMVFRSWTLRKNIWWGEVASEKVAHYHYARKHLESQGCTFTAAVVDGRRGLANVFKDMPVQVCQFHQLQTVTKYLTRRPKTDVGKELRTLALTLTKTNETLFTKALQEYEQKWRHFLCE